MRKTVINGVKKTEEEIKNEMLYVCLDQYDIKFEKVGKKTGLKVYIHGQKQYGKFLFEVKDISKIVAIVQDGYDFFVELKNGMIIPHLNETNYLAGEGIPHYNRVNELKIAFKNGESKPKNTDSMALSVINDTIRINKRYVVELLEKKSVVLFDNQKQAISKLTDYTTLYDFHVNFQTTNKNHTTGRRKLLLFKKTNDYGKKIYGLYDAVDNCEYILDKAIFENLRFGDSVTIGNIVVELNHYFKDGKTKFEFIKEIINLPEKEYLAIPTKNFIDKKIIDKNINAKNQSLDDKSKNKELEKEKTKLAGMIKGTKNGRVLEAELIKQRKKEQSSKLSEKREKESVRRELRYDQGNVFYYYDNKNYIITTSIGKSYEGRTILKTQVYAANDNITREAIQAYGIKPLFEIPMCKGIIQFGPTHFYVQSEGDFLGYNTGVKESIYYRDYIVCNNDNEIYDRFVEEYGTNKKEHWINTIPGCNVDPKYNFITRPLIQKKQSVEEMICDMDNGIVRKTVPDIEDMIIDDKYLLISERGVYDMVENQFVDYFQQYEKLLFCGEYLDIYDTPHPILLAQLVIDANDVVIYNETNPFVEIDAITGDVLSSEIPALEAIGRYEQYKLEKGKDAMILKNKPKK